MNKDDIYKNSFVKKVIDNATKIIRENPPTGKDVKRFLAGKQGRKIKRSLYMEYNANVFSRMTKIIETLDDLLTVQVFLKQYPYSKTLKKNRISRTTYMIYHIEVYFLKVASLKDKLALLINDVYEIGLPDKRVNVNLISEMKQMNRNKAVSLLKRLSKALDGITSSRNIIAHKGKYEDDELAKIKMYELVEESIKYAGFVAKLMTKSYIKKQIDIFKKNQLAIEDFINGFFLALLSDYEKKCKSLKSITS